MERLAKAQGSRDLGEKGSAVLGDVDWVRAAGMVGQRHSLALAMWRAFSLGDSRALLEVYPGAVTEAVALGLASPEVVAEAVLVGMWPRACSACKGRGRAVIPGSPYLAVEPCEACNGTGRLAPAWNAEEKRLAARLAELRRGAAEALLACVRA